MSACCTPIWVYAMQVDWRVSVKPPRLGRGLGSMPGLGSLLTSDDDMDACSAAAQAALSAARLAGYRTSTSGKASARDWAGYANSDVV